MLRALPFPAALVDDSGHVIETNRWLDTPNGDPLVDLSGEQLEPEQGLALGIGNESRWRVRPLDDDASVLLATAEREDTGDHLMRRFFSSGDSLFVVYDQFGRIIQSNSAWENLLGYDHTTIFGIDSWTLLPPEDLVTRKRVEEELRADGRSEPTFQMRAADGSYRLVQWALHFDTSVGRCFGIGRDVTEEDRLAGELHHRAFHDELTGLANRARFLEELERCVATGTQPAVLFCDLDHFKVVNDSLGHHTGDLLLAAIGRRLGSLSSSVDILVARLGGDEFVVLLGNGTAERATKAARRIFTSMSQPVLIDGHPIHAGMSIGIAVSQTSSQTDAEGLLGRADTAAYQAKRLGRNRYEVFDDAMQATVDRRFNVEEGLHTALRDHGLEVHYQPVVALPGKGIVGIEALVRWRKPNGELVGPGGFLDVAEDAGLMPRLGAFVAAEALEVGAQLGRRGRPMTVSLNVSAGELSAGSEYVTQMFDMVSAVGIEPGNVLLEITELAVVSVETVRPTLQALRNAGLRVGLDDFGTGYSSLSHLRELPIDVVKVDRSYVMDLVSDPVTRAVTGSLLDLCSALDLEVILEGIETTDHASAVEQLGGKLAQGFLFHRPMPKDELLALVGGVRDLETSSLDGSVSTAVAPSN